MDPFLIIVIVLVFIIIALLVYNLVIYKKIKHFNNVNDRISSLNVLQEFLDAIGKDIPVEEKLSLINDSIINKFFVKYSTIVAFNGAEYIIKATNVSENHWDAMKNLHKEDMFKDSILMATPKYVTIDKPNEKLVYQKTEMGRAKSAMFFPLYIDNIYIGYWIIESSEPHAFDGMDTSILEVVRENIVSVLKTMSYQNTIENIYRIDKTTGLNSAEYLYGRGKRIIDQYPESCICMFKIINIEEINEKCGRNIGTQAIIDVCNVVKRNISSQYLFVRYMGPKFAIAFSGVNINEIEEFIQSIKNEIEKIKIEKTTKSKSKKQPYYLVKTNFAIATYYKGTGLEEVTKSLEEYLDECDNKESNINCV